jgi:hypothetical protein
MSGRYNFRLRHWRIDGFAAVEHAQQLAAKGFVDEVVAQKHGAAICLPAPGLVERVAASD